MLPQVNVLAQIFITAKIEQAAAQLNDFSGHHSVSHRYTQTST
jgi:hypothetical protein